MTEKIELSPKEMEQALIEAHLDPWDKNHQIAFKAGAEAQKKKLSEVPDGELVKGGK